MIAENLRGIPLMCHTGAARAATENMTKTLATEWAAHGVRVNCVSPGPIFSKTAQKNYKHDLFGEFSKKLLTKRCGTAEEVSSAVSFLLSPGAAFITGSTIHMDGGCALYASLQVKVPDHDNLPAYQWQ